MVSTKQGRLASCRILAAILVNAVLVVAAFAQTARQLQVEVGPHHEVKAVASQVSYGEVLRALQQKLGWEIEIPPAADGLRLSYVNIDAKKPEDALAKLLEGSGLDYALLAGANGSDNIKVLVIPSTKGEMKAPKDAAAVPPVPQNSEAEISQEGASLLPPVQTPTVTGILPPGENAVQEGGPEPGPVAPSMTPLSEAANTIGTPSGMPASETGKSMTVPVSDAAKVMGAPAGVAPGDVGKTVTLPLPTGSGKRP